MDIFKITVENTETKKTYHFFTTNIEGVFDSEYCNLKVEDVKNGKVLCIKESVLNAIKK